MSAGQPPRAGAAAGASTGDGAGGAVLRRAAFAVVGLALAAVPLAGDYATSLVAEVLVFAIFAMSLDLIVGYTGLMSFGHAAFFGLSAYAVTMLGVHAGWSGWCWSWSWYSAGWATPIACTPRCC